MRPSKNQELIQAMAVEIKARRHTLELSQEELAGRCDIDRPYISLMEIARKQPTISVLLRLAEGLEYSLPEFMRRVMKRYQYEQKLGD